MNPMPSHNQTNPLQLIILFAARTYHSQLSCKTMYFALRFAQSHFANMSPTPQPTQDVIQDVWHPMTAAFLGICYGFVMSIFLVYTHSWCFVQRRYKLGNITKGTVTKKYSKVHKSKGRDYYTYFLKYIYYNDQTADYTKDLINKFMNISLNNYMPAEITNLCAEYLGFPFKFYYGPFKIADSVPSSFYSNCHIGSAIDIRYDPKYFKNCNIIINETESYLFWRYKICAFLIWSSVFLLFFGLHYQIIIYNEYGTAALNCGILFGLVVIISMISMTWRCRKMEIGCFRKKTNSTQQKKHLQCTLEGDELVSWAEREMQKHRVLDQKRRLELERRPKSAEQIERANRMEANRITREIDQKYSKMKKAHKNKKRMQREKKIKQSIEMANNLMVNVDDNHDGKEEINETQNKLYGDINKNKMKNNRDKDENIDIKEQEDNYSQSSSSHSDDVPTLKSINRKNRK